MGSSIFPPVAPPGGGTPSLPTEGQPNPLQPGEYGPTANPTVTTFNFKNIPPPVGLYITRNDSFEVFIINQAPGITVDVHARLLIASPVSILPGQPDSPPDPTKSSVPSNTIASISQSFAPIVANSGQAFFMQLSEGFLLNLSIGITGFSRKGQTYVAIILQRGDFVGGPQSGILISGYVTNPANLIWPQTGTVYPTDGAGWINSVNQANPGGGNDIVITVPAFQRWRIRSMRCLFAVANSGSARTIRCTIKDASGNMVWAACGQVTAAINGTSTVCMGPGNFTSVVDGTMIMLPLPGDTILPQGFTLNTSTSGIVAGDAYSSIWTCIEQWVEV